MDIVETLKKAGVVPVIVIEDEAKAVPLARALVKGGLPVLEVTFRTAAAAGVRAYTISPSVVRSSRCTGQAPHPHSSRRKAGRFGRLSCASLSMPYGLNTTAMCSSRNRTRASIRTVR